MAEKVTTPVAEQTEAIPVNDTAKYLAYRARLDGRSGGFDFSSIAGGRSEPSADTADTDVDGSGEPKETTEPAAESPTGDQTQQAPDGEAPEGASDGDGESGTKPGDQQGELPDGFKKRLTRQRKQAQRRIAKLQTEAAAKEAELARLRAQVNGQPAPADPTQNGSQAAPAAESPPAEENDGESSGPYPARDDYSSDDEWLADVENWEEGKPLNLTPKDTPVAEPTQAAQPKIYEQSPAARPQDEAAQRRREMFVDLEEAMDDWEGAPDNLADGFFKLMEAGSVRISDTMLNYMADDDSGAQVAAAFMASPRDSRRIARLPANQQVKAMDKLLADSAEKAKPDKTSAETKKDTSPPDIKALAGTGDTPEPTLENRKDFNEFSRIRKQMATADPLGFRA